MDGLVPPIIALFLLFLAVYAITSGIIGAGRLFARAWEGGGVIGVLLMLALWIFAFPIMAVLALIAGIANKKFNRRKESH